jgi:hypothetical protein
MPRRRVPPKRPAQPDPLFGSKEISLLVGRMMLRGKKSAGYGIMYRAFQIIKEKLGKEPLEVFTKALENVKPVVEVKSRRGRLHLPCAGGARQPAQRWPCADHPGAAARRGNMSEAERGADGRLQLHRLGVQERRTPTACGGQQGVRPLPLVAWQTRPAVGEDGGPECGPQASHIRRYVRPVPVG